MTYFVFQESSATSHIAQHSAQEGMWPYRAFCLAVLHSDVLIYPICKTYIHSKFSRGQCLHSQTSHLWLWLVNWRFLSGSIVSFTRKGRLEQMAPKASFVYRFISFSFQFYCYLTVLRLQVLLLSVIFCFLSPWVIYVFQRTTHFPEKQ